MYENYWGLKTLPFQNVPDPEFFFPSPIHEEAISRLMYVITSNKGAGLLTGEVGSGKTTVSRTLLKRLNNNRYEVGLITNPALPLKDFLKEVSYQLGITPSSDAKIDLIRSINGRLLSNFRENKETVLIVDEVQVIKDRELWEELRLLLNFQLNDRFLLTLILMGQPELKKMIVELKQLDQRIAVRYYLSSFDMEETKRYTLFRLKKSNAKKAIFTLEAIKLIHDSSHGIPREINKLCDLALLIGFLNKNNLVDSSVVKRVLADRKFYGG
ncbi:MAG: ExeA family protein [Thermodesulfobacteriota bacterium]